MGTLGGGGIISCIIFKGVATDEELAVSHREVDELRDKLKVLLNQEMSLEKAVAEVQAVGDTLGQVKQVLARVKWQATADANYFSRKVLCQLLLLKGIHLHGQPYFLQIKII
jgi:hypothetical protein